MISVDLSVSGIMAAVYDGVMPELIRKLRRKAQKQALEEWAVRRGYPGLGGRFSSNYMGSLGLSERSPSYVKKVIKAWGKYLPYTSPVRKGTHKHMRDLVREDGGHRVANKNGTDEIVTTLHVNGAKVLNLLTGDKAKYRKEFLRVNGRYGAEDRNWLEQRSNELFNGWFKEYIDAQTAKTVRARGRLAKLVGQSGPGGE
jgi:hypothetical protein